MAMIVKDLAAGRTRHNFRQSKLTHLLQPALTGQCRMGLVFTLNPCSARGATSTLRFAQNMMNMPDAKLAKNPVRMTEAQVCTAVFLPPPSASVSVLVCMSLPRSLPLFLSLSPLSLSSLSLLSPSSLSLSPFISLSPSLSPFIYLCMPLPPSPPLLPPFPPLSFLLPLRPCTPIAYCALLDVGASSSHSSHTLLSLPLQLLAASEALVRKEAEIKQQLKNFEQQHMAMEMENRRLQGELKETNEENLRVCPVALLIAIHVAVPC